MDNNPTFNKLALFVTIRGKDKVLFEEEAQAVTSTNAKGIFDVLPGHSNFISIIKEFIIIHKKQDQNQQFKIERGVLKVSNNKVSIFLGV